MRPDAKMRMFVYQPVYTVDKNGKNKEYLHTKTYSNVPYFPVRKGDVFTTEKRVKEFIEMQKHSISKVVSVSYNLSDGTCGVVLADKVIEKKEKPDEALEEIMNPTLKSKADLDRLALEAKVKPTAS